MHDQQNGNGNGNDETPSWYGTATGRGDRGLFAPGNKAAAGHTGPRRQTELRRAFLDAASPERVKEVEASLFELAVGGDTTAARIWLEHAIGRPTQALELSGPEGGPLGLDVANLTRVVLMALAGQPDAKLRVAEALGRSLDGPADVDATGA